MHGAGAQAEPHSDPWAERHWVLHGLLKVQRPSPVKQLLQQGHNF